MQMLRQDLGYALRRLVKEPAFSIVAVLTLALGIGANTAIFSVINSVLLRALPYHNSDRLVAVTAKAPGGESDELSVPEINDFRTQMPSLEDLAAFQTQSVSVTGGERPDRVTGAFVSADFFKIFNVTPVLGRTYAEGEDRRGAEKLTVINERMWRERFNGDPAVIGKTLLLNGDPYTVIGVIPSTFRHPFDPTVQVWLPMPNYPGSTDERSSRFLFALGHLKPNASVTQAQAEASTIAGNLAQAYPAENAGRSVQIEYFHDLLVRNIRPMLWMLFAAVGMILLIACANLANLLLARGLVRQKEVAVRAALGASKWRLIRQMLTEATLVGLIGGIVGLLLAKAGIYVLLSLPQNFVSTQDVRLDLRVVLFTLALSLLTGWLFGLIPALKLASPRLGEFLKEGIRGSTEGGTWSRVRGAFVVVQVALSFVLLLSAGLLIRSFDKLLRVDVGFRPENLLTLEYRLPRSKYRNPVVQWNTHRQLVEQIQQIPGAQSASLVRGLPFSGNGGTEAIILPDREIPSKGYEPKVMFNTAMPNYFETIGIPFIKGRLFNNQDTLESPRVFVINQTMAQRFWPNQDALGKQIKLAEDNTIGTVVGIVGDAKHYLIEEETKPQMYAAYSQQPGFFGTVVIRTTVEPLSLSEPVRQAVWKVDPDQPMWKFRTVDFLINYSIADRKFVLVLMGIFGGLALVLTVIGLYGVISYIVSQRTQEIGIRMALGAQIGDILRLVLKQGMTLVMIGVAIGLFAAWSSTRLLSSFLFQLSATDPLTFGMIGLLLMIVGFIACYLPARRATKVDPLAALRYE